MTTSQKQNQRLIIVSNRLPVVLSKTKDGEPQVKAGSGGLVTALAPILKNRGGIWIGWPGHPSELELDSENILEKETKNFGYTLKPVPLSQHEINKYYRGFANEIIWPLFHEFTPYCKFDPEYWNTYKEVIQKFAKKIVDNLKEDDFIWIHDYHLLGIATELRKLNVKNKIAYFLHTPFPPPEIYLRLPWRFETLNSLLEFDLIGFQTLHDRRNFMQCIRTFITDTRGTGRGQVVDLEVKNRTVRLGAFPISIDFKEFSRLAGSDEVKARAKSVQETHGNQKIILGVDRLDYSKGIIERLNAFRKSLEDCPELQEKVTMIQVVVPSRRQIPRYEELKLEIERIVGEINGQFTRTGWIPVHYIFRKLNRKELVSHYRASDIALITPLKDGMNLIAKEFCAANVEENGLLILSEFAGATAQLQNNALLANPHDIVNTAKTICGAMDMKIEERRERMKRLRRSIRRSDIFWWVNSFLEAAFATKLENFAEIEDYVPSESSFFF